MKVFEHRVFTRAGQEITSEVWCEEHWRSTGEKLFQDDTGQKEVRVLELDENTIRTCCPGCQEEGGQ